MPYELKIFEDHMLVYVKREGAIIPEERVEMFKQLKALPNKRYCFVIDNRNADLSKIDKESNLSSLGIVKELEKKQGASKCVILVSRKLEYAIARQFEQMVQEDDDFHSEFRVYYRRYAAKNFIERDGDFRFPDEIE